MNEIDWSKAPEGATHWSPPYGRFVGLWAKLDGDQWFYREPRATRWHAGLHPRADEQYVARPQPTPWSGEGLPPVGTVCEVNDARNDTWTRVDQVLASASLSGRDVAVFRIGDYIAYSPADRFRPIRTPEQIAADEREKAIAEMAQAVGLGGQPCVFGLDYIAALYDAGYRKP